MKMYREIVANLKGAKITDFHLSRDWFMVPGEIVTDKGSFTFEFPYAKYGFHDDENESIRKFSDSMFKSKGKLVSNMIAYTCICNDISVMYFIIMTDKIEGFRVIERQDADVLEIAYVEFSDPEPKTNDDEFCERMTQHILSIL